MQDVIKHGIGLVEPKQVLLFGSRARGDHNEKSDFDICFLQLSRPKDWSKFLVDVEEEPITLQKIDIVCYEDMNEEYRTNIEKEGALLYEQ